MSMFAISQTSQGPMSLMCLQIGMQVKGSCIYMHRLVCVSVCVCVCVCVCVSPVCLHKCIQ